MSSQIAKILFIAFMAITLTALTAYAQPPDTLWTKTWGAANDDVAYCVRQTDDGGFIVVGETESYGAGWIDVYLIITDASGIEEWNQTYGGVDRDGGNCVQQTLDGGYIIAGYTESFGGGGNDVYLIKTDTNGDTAWTRTIGGTTSEQAEYIQQTADGGYIIVGSFWS